MTRIRASLSYANVIATIALFLALGGGAYALSGVPDSSGVFHGCVSRKTGVLRVVKSASSCRKATGHGKHRYPGEFAVAWNQKGQPGTNGTNGTNGVNGTDGVNGAPGPGALSFDGKFDRKDNEYQLITTINGIKVEIGCGASSDSLSILIHPVDAAHFFYAFGTVASPSGIDRVTSEGGSTISVDTTSRGEIDVVAESTAAGEAVRFTRFDFSGLVGTKCNYHGLIIPGGPAS